MIERLVGCKQDENLAGVSQASVSNDREMWSASKSNPSEQSMSSQRARPAVACSTQLMVLARSSLWICFEVAERKRKRFLQNKHPARKRSGLAPCPLLQQPHRTSHLRTVLDFYWQDSQSFLLQTPASFNLESSALTVAHLPSQHSGSEIKWVDGGKALFRVSTHLVSTVYTQVRALLVHFPVQEWLSHIYSKWRWK